jgi:hypothetical protein
VVVVLREKGIVWESHWRTYLACSSCEKSFPLWKGKLVSLFVCDSIFMIGIDFQSEIFRKRYIRGRLGH